jgi:TPR repeat protein
MKPIKITLLTLFLAFSTCVSADIEHARQLMESNEFEQAYDVLYPFAQAGNADAEELIGVMYAMGLGVEKDDVRAFEWYMRSSLKGHPGAQSGIGWYYEVGRGITEIDLVRAYLWYGLSAIGGDPDAAVSIEEVVKKMTLEQIEHAKVLIEDYRKHLYPFRD